MSTTQFNYIPSTIVAPITSFEVNSGGQFQNESRVLLVGFTGDDRKMAHNLVTFPASIKEARRFCGAGSMLFDEYRRVIKNGATDVWIMSLADTGSKEVRTLTLGDMPANGGVGYLDIHGERLQITIGAGDDAVAVASAMNAAINSYYDLQTDAELHFTSEVNSNVVTLTARHAGAIFNDVDIYVPEHTHNAFSGTGLTVATTTPGSGDPDTSPVLAAINEDPWDFVLSPFSDAANMERYQAFLSDVSGRWAWDRQEYGHVFTGLVGTTSEITTHGSSYDTRHVTTIYQSKGAGNADPIWGWMVAQVARVANWLRDGTNGGVSRNQTGLVVETLHAPRDRSSWPQYASRNAFLQMGISTWKVDSAGRVIIDKIITHHQTEQGAPDTVFRDIQSIFQIVYALRKFRARLAYEHGQKVAADDNPGDLQAISTPADVDATLIHTHAELVAGGVLENTVAFAERSRVERNADNPNRYDIYAPLDRANPLDVLAANATIYAQYRATA